MKMTKITIAFALAAAAFTAPVRGAITVVDYYKLGDADAGAANGGAGNATTADSSGNVAGANALNKFGSPTYSSDVSSVAAAKTGSALSLNIPSGSSYRVVAAATTATDNFGVEGWFKPSSTSNAALAYTGSTSTSGFGLFELNGNWGGLYGGSAFVTSNVPVVANQWTYVALVKSGGTTTLYVDNSTPIAPTAGGAAGNAPAAANTSIGSNEGGGDAYSGLSDEVRFFTFAPGAFNASTDLLIAAPEPASLCLIGLAGFALCRRRRTK